MSSVYFVSIYLYPNENTNVTVLQWGAYTVDETRRRRGYMDKASCDYDFFRLDHIADRKLVRCTFASSQCSKLPSIYSYVPIAVSDLVKRHAYNSVVVGRFNRLELQCICTKIGTKYPQFVEFLRFVRSNKSAKYGFNATRSNQ